MSGPVLRIRLQDRTDHVICDCTTRTLSVRSQVSGDKRQRPLPRLCAAWLSWRQRPPSKNQWPPVRTLFRLPRRLRPKRTRQHGLAAPGLEPKWLSNRMFLSQTRGIRFPAPAGAEKLGAPTPGPIDQNSNAGASQEKRVLLNLSVLF